MIPFVLEKPLANPENPLKLGHYFSGLALHGGHEGGTEFIGDFGESSPLLPLLFLPFFPPCHSVVIFNEEVKKYRR